MAETIEDADDALMRQRACVICDPLLGRERRFYGIVSKSSHAL